MANRVLLLAFYVLILGLGERALAQQEKSFVREININNESEIVIKNPNGRVKFISSDEQKVVQIKAESLSKQVTEKDFKISSQINRLEINVKENFKERIDVTVKAPARAKVRITGEGGAIDILGNVAHAAVETKTGTIHADVPLDSTLLNFLWTLSRPRYVSDVTLPGPKEEDAGIYAIRGALGNATTKSNAKTKLDFTTERGVILLNVDPNLVPSDLRERPLTEAAKTIVKSGDKDLVEAIRRAVPKVYGDYAKTLPPRKDSVLLVQANKAKNFATEVAPQKMRVNATVTDKHGRAISGLTTQDFALIENGKERQIAEVQPSTAPFNLVLLLDVSGSVEESIDFIRKAARNFLNTVSPQDRVAIVSFRNDVQIISEFTTDRKLLSERLESIEAGGATSLYDALAYTLVHTLKPLRGERTAIVILSDGDDNHSFIPFEALTETISESGALIYPLYVPSGLIRESSQPKPNTTLDPLRQRYLTVTSSAEKEGARLAEMSGGVYYPIRQLEGLQKAYDDVVAQLRMAYTITYVSDLDGSDTRRIKVNTKREGMGVRLSPVVGAKVP